MGCATSLLAAKDESEDLDLFNQLASATFTDHASLTSTALTVVIFGATGDLARKKLFPALYQLCMLGHFPRNLNIVGYGRSPVDIHAFVLKQCANIKEDQRLAKEEFVKNISFHAGGYSAPESYVALDQTIKEYEHGSPGNRLFFLSVPPTIFGDVVEQISSSCRALEPGFTRLMIEKPFGKDSATFDELNTKTQQFDESQLFRLDHYLGKEVILNIATLRWANQVFEPGWSRESIECVQLTFKEDLGTGGRGGYFDGFGIIRDIIQNHLLQAFMWLAMEPPASMNAAEVTREKVRLLRRVKAPSLGGGRKRSVFLGQFAASADGDQKAYLDDETVPRGSRCPTFAALVLEVDNDRWRGVPFLFTAGKGMDERVCEVRVRYKPQPTGSMMRVAAQNELVMRVQPDESVYLLTTAKEPGITAEQVRKPVVMDMNFREQFGVDSPSTDAYVGDAYERMLLNAARGDQTLFVSAAELVEAWRIFTPLLHQIDADQPQPVLHPFGVLPAGYIEWTAQRGCTIRDGWMEFIAQNGHLSHEMVRVFRELDVDGSGRLEYAEVAKLAQRFFDGRKPTEQRVRQIFRSIVGDDDGATMERGISLEQLMHGALKMNRAFAAFKGIDHSSTKPRLVQPEKAEVVQLQTV